MCVIVDVMAKQTDSLSKLSKLISIRVTEETFNEWDAARREAGVSMPTYVRLRMEGKEVVSAARGRKAA